MMGLFGNNTVSSNFSDPATFLSPVQQLRSAPRGQFEQALMSQARGTGLTDPRRAALGRQLGDISSGANQAAQTGISNLAQAGGVSSGARERLMLQANRQAMLQRQQARGIAEEGSMADRLGLQQAFAQQESSERGSDIKALNARNRLLAQLQASKELGQAQIDTANKPDVLNRLSLGIF